MSIAVNICDTPEKIDIEQRKAYRSRHKNDILNKPDTPGSKFSVSS